MASKLTQLAARATAECGGAGLLRLTACRPKNPHPCSKELPETLRHPRPPQRILPTRRGRGWGTAQVRAEQEVTHVLQRRVYTAEGAADDARQLHAAAAAAADAALHESRAALAAAEREAAELRARLPAAERHLAAMSHEVQ